MNKKVKLNLDEIKVKSFVTALKDEDKKALKGGQDRCSLNKSGCESWQCP